MEKVDEEKQTVGLTVGSDWKVRMIEEVIFRLRRRAICIILEISIKYLNYF